jgi:hypothetical protein
MPTTLLLTALQVSMMEIYVDAVHDLLLPPGESSGRSLEVSGLGAGELPQGADRVPGLTWREVRSVDEVKQVRSGGGQCCEMMVVMLLGAQLAICKGRGIAMAKKPAEWRSTAFLRCTSFPVFASP